MKIVLGSRISLMAISLAATLLPLSLTVQAKTTLYVGMNGGTMQKTYTDYVFPPFEKTNNVNIVVVPGTSSDILAKAIASKSHPQMNLMFLDDGIMYRAIDMNLCEKQQHSAASAQLYPQAHIEGDMATGINIGLTGLGYNTKIFAENKWPAPTSWNDLSDPKYKGKVVFQSMPSSTFGLHGFLMINRLQGGSESNVAPGFKAWPTTVGPNVKVYIANSAVLSEMIQTDQAAIFPFTPSLVSTLSSQGLPVAFASPKEGSVLLMSTQCVLANNSSPELAQKLASWVISPEAQRMVLEHASYIPTNSQVSETGTAGDKLKQIQSYIKNAVVLDWKVINQNQPQWNKQWNRSVEQ